MVIEALARGEQHLATWNVRGNLNGSTGKLDAVLRWASQTKVGVLAVQEASTAWVYGRKIRDCCGGSWQLFLTPPLGKGSLMGQGFLVSEKYDVSDFESVSD